MDVKKCFEKGLLKRDIRDIKKSIDSVSLAKHKLEIAKKVLSIEVYGDSIINSYSSMFHAARALLFKDGVKERSHYALFLYLKEKYSDEIEPKFLNELNNLRMQRHDLTYGLEKLEITKEEANDVTLIAEEFIANIEKILSKKS